LGDGNKYLREVAAASRVPVLNMQCDVLSPFQILADALTIIGAVRAEPARQEINVSWATPHSYQKPISVPQSLILLMTRFGMNVTLSHPPEYNNARYSSAGAG